MLRTIAWHWFASHFLVIAIWVSTISVAALLLYTKWHLVEARVKAEMVAELEKMGKVRVSIDSVKFMPVSGHVSLKNLVVYGTPGPWHRNHFASVESMTFGAARYQHHDASARAGEQPVSSARAAGRPPPTTQVLDERLAGRRVAGRHAVAVARHAPALRLWLQGQDGGRDDV